MTEEVFKAGIQRAIEDALADPDVFSALDMYHLDTAKLAEAVHTYIVNKLQPPF